jgi:hypothetical protein
MPRESGASRIVGWAKALFPPCPPAHSKLQSYEKWWARRESAFTHPTSVSRTMTSARGHVQRKLTRICRGNACTSQLLEFCSLISTLQPQDASVKLLSITRHFLLCIRASVARQRYEPRRCVSLSRNVSQHPKILNAVSGFVLDCSACTGVQRLKRSKFSPVKLCG